MRVMDMVQGFARARARLVLVLVLVFVLVLVLVLVAVYNLIHTTPHHAPTTPRSHHRQIVPHTTANRSAFVYLV